METKEIIKNKFFARRTTSYREYKQAGGTGSKEQYKEFVKANEDKAGEIENLLNENYK